MLVSVRFFTVLREIVNKKEEKIEFGSDQIVTLDRVLKTLAERYGNAFIEYLYDPKTCRVHGFLQFLVNGQIVSTLKGMETELKDGDVLVILPLLGGG